MRLMIEYSNHPQSKVHYVNLDAYPARRLCPSRGRGSKITWESNPRAPKVDCAKCLAAKRNADASEVLAAADYHF